MQTCVGINLVYVVLCVFVLFVVCVCACACMCVCVCPYAAPTVIIPGIDWKFRLLIKYDGVDDATLGNLEYA